ncbi:MAG: hypothetical protein ACYDAC_03310 [Candidatus Dormibacteria bacterium]
MRGGRTIALSRPRLLAAGAVADAVLGVAVFLPWAGVTLGTASVAGWGSPPTPRLLGLFVLAAAATALTLRGGSLLVAAGERAAPAMAASLLDGAAAILTLTVVAAPAAFVGTATTSSVRAGAWLALGAALVALLAGLVSVAAGPRSPAPPASPNPSAPGGPPRRG